MIVTGDCGDSDYCDSGDRVTTVTGDSNDSSDYCDSGDYCDGGDSSDYCDGGDW